MAGMLFIVLLHPYAAKGMTFTNISAEHNTVWSVDARISRLNHYTIILQQKKNKNPSVKEGRKLN